MTFDEIKRIPDLQIEVTPAVEDAFYFLRGLEADFPESPDDAVAYIVGKLDEKHVI